MQNSDGTYVCDVCEKPADYVHRATGEAYCDDHFQENVNPDSNPFED